MFTNEWLKSIQDKYSAASATDDIHMNNYQLLLNHLRATDENTPKHMTANLLKRLLTGESVSEISRIIGTAADYNHLLGTFNIFDKKAADLKNEASNPLLTEDERKELKRKWEIAWEKRESYWAAMQIVNIPLTQVCFSIENKKYIWCVDIDRII